MKIHLTFRIKLNLGLQLKYMANTKKRLSKTAKEALKKLNESKLLAASKTIIDSKADQTFKPTVSPIKTSGAIKERPSKKRG